MQRYKSSSENLEGISEISGYMLLKISLYQVETMSKCGLSVDDASPPYPNITSAISFAILAA